MPPNVSAELQRDMARLGFVMGQIRDIEDARRKRLEQQPETGPHAMVRLLNEPDQPAAGLPFPPALSLRAAGTRRRHFAKSNRAIGPPATCTKTG